MRRKASTRAAQVGATGVEPRRARRYHAEELTCDLGEVIDLSAAGMRVRCRRRPPARVGQVLHVKLESATHRLPVSGRVQWIRRKGLRTVEMGIQFVDLKPGQAAAVESLGMFGCVDLEALAAARRPKARPAERPRPKVRVAVQLPDYYAALGVPRCATDEQIRKAYRALARKLHPDVCSDPESEKRFLQVREAYEVLRDRELRATYDRRTAA